MGSGDNRDRYNPTEIKSLDGTPIINHISAGGLHSLIVDTNGKIYSFGFNMNGQLGMGVNMPIIIPKEIPGILAKAVSCGYIHSLVLTMDDKIYSFGDNKYSQLGTGGKSNRNKPTWISNSKVEAISAGTDHSLIILNDRYIQRDPPY